MKYQRSIDGDTAAVGRSREGAWIEMLLTLPIKLGAVSRSREGAWIEIRAIV